jgi:hypothetical protein
MRRNDVNVKNLYYLVFNLHKKVVLFSIALTKSSRHVIFRSRKKRLQRLRVFKNRKRNSGRKKRRQKRGV